MEKAVEVRDQEDVEGEEGVSGETVGKMAAGDRYRISHRNPQFSGAETTCLWELKEVCMCVCVCV